MAALVLPVTVENYYSESYCIPWPQDAEAQCLTIKCTPTSLAIITNTLEPKSPQIEGQA